METLLIGWYQYIGDYVRIVAAICNKYRPALASDKPGDAFLAQRILYLASLTENPLQKLVQQHGKRPVVKEWIKLMTQMSCLIFLSCQNLTCELSLLVCIN